MREDIIRISPFESLMLLAYKGKQVVNEHSTLELSARIEANRKQEYIERSMKETWVEVTAENFEGQTKLLFYGILSRLTIEEIGGECIMHLKLYSGTKLMDYDKHIRSFQSSSITYRKVLEVCTEGYENSGIIMTKGKQTNLPHFLLQYLETDWEFFKRLASTLNTIIVPSIISRGVKFFFGIPEKKADANFNSLNYRICNNSEEYEEKNAKGVKVAPMDTVYYILTDRDIFDLGDTLLFNERKTCIWKILSELKGNELYHTYYLKAKNGFQVSYQENGEISGASIKGTTIDVEKMKVKMKMEDDENSGESGSCWFDFSTIYSSADGAGWYCMPEIGDTVRLYFPNAHEENAYVISAVHEKENNGIRVNPSNKIWRNKEGKEIRMNPEKIILTNNNGISVELSDQSGIKLRSNKGITIMANDQISINSSRAGLELKAQNKLVLKQAENTLELKDGIKMIGSNINMQ